MIAEEFNDKYSSYLENMYEDDGLSYNNKDVIEYLDFKFKDFILMPGFKWRSIKIKINYVKFDSNLSEDVKLNMENNINIFLTLNNQIIL